MTDPNHLADPKKLLQELSQAAAQGTTYDAEELAKEAENLLGDKSQDAQKEGLKEFQMMNRTLGRPGAMALLHALFNTLKDGEKRFKKIKHIPGTVPGGGMEIKHKNETYFMQLGEVSAEHDHDAEFDKITGGLSQEERQKLDDNFSSMILFARKVYSQMLEINREGLSDLKKTINPLGLKFHEANVTFSIQQNGKDLEPRMGCLITKL